MDSENTFRTIALSAKEKAEEKLASGDYRAAQFHISQAKNACPDLEGLNLLVETIDIFNIESARNIHKDLPDYYKILGVDPSNTFAEIRKKFRKRSMLFHPDKHKSANWADNVFKILSSACDYLSDESRRSEYDYYYRLYLINQEARNNGSIMGFNFFNTNPPNSANDDMDRRTPHAPAPPSPPPPPPSSPSHEMPDLNESYPDPASPNPNQPNPNPDPVPPRRRGCKRKPESFWTRCTGCRYRFEFAKVFLRLEINCCVCREVFVAEEIERPVRE